ncbi:MAG: TolC family protein, partial [Mizugakiibacter sp.]|uniref:TolC family protein n=1 Tax=Mizugakiibacter sp. TaxID=1972610 RepID=UPI00321170F1
MKLPTVVPPAPASARRCILRTCAAALLATLVAACASVPSAPYDAQAGARALGARRLDDPGLRALLDRFGLDAAPEAAWTPDRVTVAALYFDPALASARAAAMRAAADAERAVQRANPTLSLTPEKVYQAAAGGAASPWTITLGLAFQLLHPGQRAARRAGAEAATAAAGYDAAEAVWASRSRAVGALRGVLLARRAETLAAEAAAADAAWSASAQRRLAAGESDRSEWLLAQDAAARAAAATQARAQARVAAEHALAGALGVPRAALADARLEWPGLDAPPAPDALPPAALAEDAAWNRLDLQALLARYRGAEAQLREAAGTRWPQLGVAPGYIYDRGDRKFSFGVDVELPLFHGAGATIRAAAAARDEAAAAVRQRQAAILGGMDAARADYAARDRGWRSLRRAADAAARAQAQAQAALAAGAGDRP